MANKCCVCGKEVQWTLASMDDGKKITFCSNKCFDKKHGIGDDLNASVTPWFPCKEEQLGKC
jgi:hypothetical protein